MNIYPREVELALEKHAAVRECTVFGIPDEKWGEALCAYVVTEDGAAVTDRGRFTVSGRAYRDGVRQALAHRLDRAHTPVTRADPALLPTDPRPIVDLFDASLSRTLRLLARAGLADATILPLRAQELSDGQRMRLALALALARAERKATSAHPATVLADEFASSLDPATAACVAASVAKCIRRAAHVRFVCAAARDDVLEPLAPDLLVHQPMLGPPTILARKPVK